MKGTKKYGNKIFIITENQTNALREEINMADYKKNGNRCGGPMKYEKISSNQRLLIILIII
jgi:hypothetical protein